MADPRGFLEVQRRLGPLPAPLERLGDYRDVHLHAPEGEVREQARRCMACGVPFCHTGCPLGNLIPDWNDLVHRGRWQEASERLHSTNNFPELTGKLCPAPCEEACVLTINDDAVTIKEIERAIVERAWEEGWIVPQPAAARSGRTVGVVGSGPAGLAAAQQLARAGHAVTVYERDDRAGGLLRYGIPDFKLEKELIDRRVEQLVAEGVEFAFGVDVGARRAARRAARAARRGRARDRRAAAPAARRCPAPSWPASTSRCTTSCSRTGASPGLPVSGPELQRARPARRDPRRRRHERRLPRQRAARGLRLGASRSRTARRRRSERNPQKTWPEWPFLLRTYPAHEEGGEREWQLETIALEGEAAASSACARGASSSPASPRPACGARAGARRRGRRSTSTSCSSRSASPASRRDDPLYAQLGLELGARDTRARRRRVRDGARTASSPPATACAAPT